MNELCSECGSAQREGHHSTCSVGKQRFTQDELQAIRDHAEKRGYDRGYADAAAKYRAAGADLVRQERANIIAFLRSKPFKDMEWDGYAAACGDAIERGDTRPRGEGGSNG